jgi:hypothetical protein
MPHNCQRAQAARHSVLRSHSPSCRVQRCRPDCNSRTGRADRNRVRTADALAGATDRDGAADATATTCRDAHPQQQDVVGGQH